MAGYETTSRDDVRRLVVRGRYSNIPLITDFVAEVAAAAGLDETSVFHCQMAVDEACTNVIEHAYGGEDAGDIEITCAVEPGLCTIRVVDWGQPFDPASVPVPDFSGDLEAIKPGGIGLHLMRQLMDDVRFYFGEGANTLVMVKRYTPSDEKQPTEQIRTSEIEAGIWFISPEGRLDAAAAPMLEQTLRDLLDEGVKWLVVDMAGVSYISSRGLKALVSAWRIAREKGGDVVVMAMQPHVYNVFDTIGFTRLFTVCQSQDEALTHVHSQRA